MYRILRRQSSFGIRWVRRVQRNGRFVGLDVRTIKIAVAIAEEGRNGEVLTDSALQIHVGAGFTLEYPISPVLCDARDPQHL